MKKDTKKGKDSLRSKGKLFWNAKEEIKLCIANGKENRKVNKLFIITYYK